MVEEEEPRRRGSTRQKHEDRQRALEAACLEFWIAMFDHELTTSEFESGIISGLAVLGLNTERGGWKEAINYTPILSAIVTVVRALVIQKAWKDREDEIQRLQEEGLREDAAQQQATSVFRFTQTMVHRFMTLTGYGSEPNPMNRVLHMRTYGYKIRMTTAAEGMVMWQDEKICIGQIHFTMNELRSMVHGLCESTRLNLIGKALLLDVNEWGNVTEGRTQLPELNLNMLHDNPVEIIEGWSFLKDTRSTFSVCGEKWIFHRILSEPVLRAAFIRDVGQNLGSMIDIPWDSERVHRYLQDIRTLKEQMFVLVHITGGAPARGTEIISVEHKNGADGRGGRGVFIEGGLIAFVTSYHKGYSASGKIKTVHRYVPKEVSEIVVYYLWLVQPFVEILQMLERGQSEFGSFLWEPEPEETWAANEDEEKDWEDDPEEVEGDRDEEGGGKEEDQNTARNPDGYWGTDRVRKVMQQETGNRIGAKIGTSVWRHVYPAIQREFTCEKDVVRTLDAIYEGREHGEEADKEARAKQSGHGRRMEEMIYGRSLRESPFHTMSERRSMRKVSVDWYRFLHFPSAWEEGAMDPESRWQMQIGQQEAEFQRWKRIRQTDLSSQLTRLVGKGAEFQGLQRSGLEAIIRRDRRVLIVMRTGGGKSLFFMLPAACSRDGVTIVVIPINSLRADLKGRCDKVGVTYAE